MVFLILVTLAAIEHIYLVAIEHIYIMCLETFFLFESNYVYVIIW